MIGKGQPKRGGRTKGTPNRTTTAVKAAMEAAFTRLGGVDALVEWAKAQPTEFYKLYVKLLPIQVSAEHKVGGVVTIVVDTGVPRAPDE